MTLTFWILYLSIRSIYSVVDLQYGTYISTLALLLYSDEEGAMPGAFLEQARNRSRDLDMAVGAVNCVAYLYEHFYDMMIPVVLCRFTLSRYYDL
jgi:hypothetical protein